MPREITDPEGITWTCIQAFAGLGNSPDKVDAARVGDADERIHVVCTPSGEARSVRLQLAADWEARVSDDDLLQAIRRAVT